MQPFGKCPVCGGDLVQNEVEKILCGGVNTAVIKVCAEYACAVERCYTCRRP